MDFAGSKRGRRFALAAIVTLGLGLGAAGCSGSDDDTSDAAETAATVQDTGGGGKSGNGNKSAGKRGGGGKGGNAAGRKAQGAGGATQSDTEPALMGDKEEAREGVKATEKVYTGFAEAFKDGVANAKVDARTTLENADGNESLVQVCDLMSKEAKEQTIEYARVSAGLADVEWTCEKATGLMLRRAHQTGGLKRSLNPQIVGVNTEGDRATASIQFGGKGPISSIPLVKEDGEWKLGSSPTSGG